MPTIIASSDNIFTEYFFIMINHVQKSVINLVETLIHKKKKVKFSEVNENIKIHPCKSQEITQTTEKLEIIINDSNDDFDFFVDFE